MFFEDEPLEDFIREERYGHPILFPLNNLKEGDLWSRPGCLNNDEDNKIFAIADEEGILLVVSMLTNERTEVGLKEN